MNSKRTDAPARQAIDTPTRKAMKQFSQTEAESGRDTPEIDQPPPPRKDERRRGKSGPPGQLDPGSSPYEEPNSEKRDR